MKNLPLVVILLVANTLLAQNQNLSNGNVFDGEPYLAINPNNSQHLVVAWMGWINLANQFKIKTKTSFDGGKSWSAAVELPHMVSTYSSADPAVEFNQNGEVLVSYIDFTGTTPPVTGGVYLTKSTDGGLSWNTPTEVISTNFDGTKWPIDRPWLAIDRSNGANQGNVYICTFNLNRTNPPFNPYVSVSSDGGNTFTTRYADTALWLAGSLNPLPLCSPTVSASGVFHAAYPSYVLTQSLYAQSFLASSTDGGVSFNHNNIITYNPPNNIGDYPSSKRASLLLSDPSNSDHLAYLYLSAVTGDLDVYLIESFDAGLTWSSDTRLNDDPIYNNKMQDLIWGDFDSDGDLIVSWRDRRNASDSTYQTSSEIWASFRSKDSSHFSPNFQISNTSVAFDTVLESAGNDFMCIKLQDDTLNAVWGDTRSGDLNIWFQRMGVDGSLISIQEISKSHSSRVKVYPNPTKATLFIEGNSIEKIQVYDLSGNQLCSKKVAWNGEHELDIKHLSEGIYIVEIQSEDETFSKRIIKN